MAGELRAPLIVVESLDTADTAVRSSLVVSESLAEGYANLLGSLLVSEALSEGYRNLRVPLLIVEALHPIAPEEEMSTIPFPGFGNSTIDPTLPAAADPFHSSLPGLDITVHKKPMMKARVAEASSGQEDRTSLWAMPRWDFELTYNYLEDKSGAASSLKTIQGFYLARGGTYDSWLFKDPDDYLVVNNPLGTADGVTTQFYFQRNLGGFQEIIGQVDTANTISVYGTVSQSANIPGSGPFTITVTHSADFLEDLGVKKSGVPMTKVTTPSGTGQYSVSGGVYTFWLGDAGQPVVITYRYNILNTAYTVTMPNYLVFTSAPANGTIISADFQFFYRCRFIEDMLDFEKFADKLWSLHTCEFRSILS